MKAWLARFFHRRLRRDLKELQSDTDSVLKSAFEVRKQIGGAVNWARLQCWQAEEWQDESGNFGVRVWIEKASPDAEELQRFVRTSLRERGWENVEARTEW